ncbi:50S ribosomal protein L16 [archaeon]|nr:50S ribosomal protein L16 [archaeon]
MATLRKGKCYRHITRPYTRKSKFQKKGYIKAIPNKKVVRFDMGEATKNFGFEVTIVSKVPHQIRHNALESARRVINKELQDGAGLIGYHLKLRTYPHQALRENKMLSGAHADRLQTGMAHSFGKVVGIAAVIKRGQKIFSARVDKENLELAKRALQKAVPRLPGTYTITAQKVAS